MSARCGVSGGGSTRGSTPWCSTVKSSARARDEIVGTDVVRRVEAPVLHVRTMLVVEVVVDGEEHAAGSDGGEQCVHRSLTRVLGERRVLQRHEVERRGGKRGAQCVAAPPLDRDALSPGGRPCPADGDVGHVDRHDGPTAPGEPDRVGAFTATDVERTPGIEVGDLGDEPAVGAPTPHRVARARRTVRPTRPPARPRRTGAHPTRARSCTRSSRVGRSTCRPASGPAQYDEGVTAPRPRRPPL